MNDVTMEVLVDAVLSPEEVALERLRIAAKGAADCIDEFGELFDEHLDALQTTLLEYERSTLAPDDEHTADHAERVLCILDRWDDAMASVTVSMVRDYLDAPGHGWTPSSEGPGSWTRTVPPKTYRVALADPPETGSPLTPLEWIAADEGRHLALVLCDVLPRRWGLDG